MQLPMIMASDEQNVKPYPKSALDACFAFWRSQAAQETEYICGGIITD
jgi:hypothetical protein